MVEPGESKAADRLLLPFRRLRHLPDRLLHPLRRRRARRRVREAADRLGPPGGTITILFVCHGNICRSPYAAGALRRDLPDALRDRVRIESGGLIGPGRPSPEVALEVARDRGVDLAGHVSRLVAPEAVAAADLVLVMAVRQARQVRDRGRADRAGKVVVALGDLDPEIPSARTVRDPIFQGRDVFEAVFGRIDRCVRALVEALGGSPTRVARARQAGEARGVDPDRPASN